MMKRLMILMLVLVLVGCTYLKPSDTVLIDNQAGNAKAMNALVQVDPAVSPALKQWMKADYASWTWLSDVAHRRTPTTMPVR